MNWNHVLNDEQIEKLAEYLGFSLWNLPCDECQAYDMATKITHYLDSRKDLYGFLALQLRKQMEDLESQSSWKSCKICAYVKLKKMIGKVKGEFKYCPECGRKL